MPGEPESIFRSEAIAALEEAGTRGAPLRLLPAWAGAAYWFVVSVVVAAVLFSLVAPVSEYAEGPAIVRVEGRLDLSTAAGGLVMGVDVAPGMAVRAGQRLVHFHLESERQELEQLEREFELKVVRMLMHPGDDANRQALSGLRAARERAEAKVRERSLFAPRAGVVRNLRIRPGQHLEPGAPVLSLVDESQAAFSVLALVPGQFRPLLRPGLPLRFSLDGYQRAHDELVVESVGDEAIGPAEARRTLGQEVGDAVPAQGSLVLVRARLPRATFNHQGRTFPYYDGIPGRVDIRVRSLRLAAMIFPPIAGLFGS